MTAVFDDRACALGEGPLWHPERRQLFWFDILGKRLLTRNGDGASEWAFDEHVSAAGWIDRDTLLMASETGLWQFGLETGRRDLIVALEADNPVTRSNDGRADPWGGFWIGTMGKAAEPGAGAIYRLHQGELRRVQGAITVSNTICFAPDRACAYFSDTVTGRVMRQGLDAQTGWPEGEAAVFLDLWDQRLNPDGAVVDADGTVWIALWGARRVAAYSAEGQFVRSVAFPAQHTSCPAFGGDGLTDLFCTSARQDLSDRAIADEPRNGMTFVARGVGRGQAEHRVIL